MTNVTPSPTTRNDPKSASVRTVLCDLDGVVWLARRAIPGSAEAVSRLREAGVRVLFVTNNSAALLRDQERALASIGIPAEGDVLTSAQAAASLVGAGERVLAFADVGVVEALHARAAVVVDREPFDVVMVGLHRHFDYDGLHRASAAVRSGARFIATNDDATFPTPDGLTPGAGALVAAVSTAAGVEPVLAGKPHEPMASLARSAVGPSFTPAQCVVVGDRPSTDGAFAETLGCRFALVRSGVTSPKSCPDQQDHGDRTDDSPWIDVDDLAAAASEILPLTAR